MHGCFLRNLPNVGWPQHRDLEEEAEEDTRGDTTTPCESSVGFLPVTRHSCASTRTSPTTRTD